MASIKEAYDNTIGESFTGLKLLLWAVPLSYCRSVIAHGSYSFLSICIIGIFGFFLCGFLTESAHNAIAKKPILIPSFNLLSMAINSLLTILALGVYVVAAYLCISLINGYISLESPVWTMTIHILIWLFFAAIPVSVFLVFIRELKVTDAFNLPKIFKIMGDAFVMFSYLIIKLGLLSTIVIGFITYVFYLFAGLDNILISFIWSVAIMYNLVIAANYLAQFSEEKFSFLEKKESKDILEGARLY